MLKLGILSGVLILGATFLFGLTVFYNARIEKTGELLTDLQWRYGETKRLLDLAQTHWELSRLFISTKALLESLPEGVAAVATNEEQYRQNISGAATLAFNAAFGNVRSAEEKAESKREHEARTDMPRDPETIQENYLRYMKKGVDRGSDLTLKIRELESRKTALAHTRILLHTVGLVMNTAGLALALLLVARGAR